MELVLPIDMLPQPNDWTCGPTCLHAVYRFWGSDITLDEVIARAKQLEGGGTLAVLLGCDALRHGYQATIYTFNLTAFDPTWFREPRVELIGKLKQQLQHKDSLRLRAASHGYIEFLELGGKILMEDLNLELIGRFLDQSIPIIAGLSSTFLYRESREENVTQRRDDISGLPQGHFVVLRGINHLRHTVRVADPYQKNPWSQELDYEIPFERVICAILLGVLTYDANLLIIHPK